MPLPSLPILRSPLPNRVAPVFVQVVSSGLAGLLCRLFLLYGPHMVTRDVHRSTWRRLMCPAQYHFIFLTLQIIYLFKADGNVDFEDIPVFGVCRPACHDFSLYLFVLVLFLDAVMLSQVYVAFNIFYLLFTFIGMLSTTITFFFEMFIFRPICLLLSDSYCGIPVHMHLPSAKQRLLRKSPSIFPPLFSQFNLLHYVVQHCREQLV